MAQPFHHTILPLATLADRRTEIRWGLRDFELRFGRRPTGLWLPETAVDLATLRLLVDEGVTHTILAPWQLAGEGLDTRRPYRVEVGDGRSIVVVAYDGGLSTSVSFETDATTDADRFARERVMPRLSERIDGDDGATPFALIATDGELYGHHQPYRDYFLQRLVGPADLGYEVATLADVVREAGPSARPAAIVERSSWSCHHGVARWETACDCVADGDWKAPLRAALDRLAASIDALTDEIARTLPGSPDPWAARDAYVDVVIGAVDEARFAADRLPGADDDGTAHLRDAHGRPALAPGDVRELRLVLGDRRPPRDGAGAQQGDACRPAHRRSRRDRSAEPRSRRISGPLNPSAHGLRATG